jgi:hypothetical protein
MNCGLLDIERCRYSCCNEISTRNAASSLECNKPFLSAICHHVVRSDLPRRLPRGIVSGTAL